MAGAKSHTGSRLVMFCWLALLVWQIAWHGLLPTPFGSRSWILVLMATAPLLMLTSGVLQARQRSYFWAMFLVMLYFLIGVTEAWSNADQRIAASMQIILSLGFFSGLYLSWRSPT